MQDVQLYAGIYEQITNYISVRWTCSRCMDQGDNPTCEICCGSERQKSWAGFDDIDPLEEFTKWILKAFDKKYKTLIYAHYG